MIKKILSIASILTLGVASAQTFQFNDHHDNDISGTTHYVYGTKNTLSSTKFHIKNLTSSTQRFSFIVTKDYIPYSNSSLAVCFGAACFSASASLSGAQVINNGSGDAVAANGIYTDLKIAPVTWPWVNTVADSAVWNLVLVNEADANDTVAVKIIYKFRLTGDINNDGLIGVGEVAGDISGNGIIDGSEKAGDVNGDEIIGDGELADDINGDGIYDSNDFLTSVDDIKSSDVKLNAFPIPASNSLTINYSIKGNSSVNALKVYDILGQEIITRNLSGNNGSLKLDVSSLNSGVYFYAIKSAGKTLRTERFLVR